MRDFKEEKKKPIMVEIPESGQFIDVRPFINLVLEENEKNARFGLQVLTEASDDCIETINRYTFFEDEAYDIPGRLRSLFDHLYAVKGVFKNTTVLKSEGKL